MDSSAFSEAFVKKLDVTEERNGKNYLSPVNWMHLEPVTLGFGSRLKKKWKN